MNTYASLGAPLGVFRPEKKQNDYILLEQNFFLVKIIDQDCTQKIDLLIEESMGGKNLNVDGHFEYIIQRGDRKICIVEAKRDDIEQGIVQDLLGCDAVADVEGASCVYGIVTNYLQWTFFRSLDDRIEQDDATLLLESECGTAKAISHDRVGLYYLDAKERSKSSNSPVRLYPKKITFK